MSMLTEEQLYGTNGHMLSQSLFKEKAKEKDNPIFTLSPRKVEGFINLRSIYLSLTEDDPSEYVFAEEVFGDYVFWKNLCNKPWFKEYLYEWRETADTRRKSKAFKAIVDEAKEGRNKFAASKYLIEEPWKGKFTRTKAQKEKSTSQAFSSVSEDLENLRAGGHLN